MLRDRLKIFLNLTRALFPRWDFYDRPGAQVHLEVKLLNSADWRRVSFAQKRRLFAVFVNPDYNMALAQISLIEQFVESLRELQMGGKKCLPEEVFRLSSYVMLCAVVRASVGDQAAQFRILAARGEEPADEIFALEIFP